MDKVVCDEKHRRVDERIESLQYALNDHDSRIDRVERICAEDRILINNLCKQIESLTNTIKWIGGPLLAGIAGFFFYAIQQATF